MKCRELLKIYQLYLDRELEESLLEQVQEHMEDCPECNHRIKFEFKFKTTITKKVKSSTDSAPDELREQILNNLS